MSREEGGGVRLVLMRVRDNDESIAVFVTEPRVGGLERFGIRLGNSVA